MDISKKYNVIYADPPWSFKTYSNKGKDRSPEKLAIQITAILKKKNDYYSSNLENASKELTWENESEHLKNIYNNLK